MKKIRKQEAENGSLENKIREKALEIRERARDELEAVKGRDKSIRKACGNCQGCVGNSNYYEKAVKFGVYSIEENSCYTEALATYNPELLENHNIILYYSNGNIAITEAVTTEELAEILIEAEKQLDAAIGERQEKREELSEKL